MIMVVDDDQGSREPLAEILESEGYRVLVAENGLTALKLLETNVPRIVLLDLNMPVMDGYRFLESLQECPADSTPAVIVITAEEPKYVPAAKAVLRKPLKLDQLLELMREL